MIYTIITIESGPQKEFEPIQNLLNKGWKVINLCGNDHRFVFILEKSD